jgi:tetratricopeptide (TPR) repeat protein
MPSSPRIPQAEESMEPMSSFSVGEPLAFPLPPPLLLPATISADELARPISRKGFKLLLKADGYIEARDHDKAIDTLQQALKERSAAPYAHGLLGTEYLKIGRIADAVTELEQAVQLMPHHAPSRSNLGYALYLSGNQERAEQEVRKALTLDSSNPKTRYVLSVIRRGPAQ